MQVAEQIEQELWEREADPIAAQKDPQKFAAVRKESMRLAEQMVSGSGPTTLRKSVDPSSRPAACLSILEPSFHNPAFASPLKRIV